MHVAHIKYIKIHVRKMVIKFKNILHRILSFWGYCPLWLWSIFDYYCYVIFSEFFI